MQRWSLIGQAARPPSLRPHCLPGNAADTVATSSASTSAGREVAPGATSHTTGRLQGSKEGTGSEEGAELLQAPASANTSALSCQPSGRGKLQPTKQQAHLMPSHLSSSSVGGGACSSMGCSASAKSATAGAAAGPLPRCARCAAVNSSTRPPAGPEAAESSAAADASLACATLPVEAVAAAAPLAAATDTKLTSPNTEGVKTCKGERQHKPAESISSGGRGAAGLHISDKHMCMSSARYEPLCRIVPHNIYRPPVRPLNAHSKPAHPPAQRHCAALLPCTEPPLPQCCCRAAGWLPQ